MLSPTNQNYLNNKKILKNLLLKNSPDKYRPQFWLSMTGAEREKEQHKGYYYKIIYEYPEYIPSKWDTVITADLKRTYPNDEYFKKPENRKKIKNVLTAYSRRNSKIGYCQGFNFIVARLLRIFNKEQDAFWIFVQIIENILPCEFYSDLVGIMSDCSLCLTILKETNKKIMKKLEGLEVVLNNLLYKWFISLFVENTSNETFLNIWDALMVDGDVVLLRAVSSILELAEDKILQCEGIESLTEFFEEKMSKYNFPREKLMKMLLNDGLLKFSPKQIEKMKEEINKEVINNLIKTKKNEVKKTQLDINGVEIECDLDYPFCLKEFENNENKSRNRLYLPVQNKKYGDEPLTIEEKEKYKQMLQNEAIKDFELKNIQVVQTFRTNNPIDFKSNYFQKNSELKEGPFIDEEEEMVNSQKREAVFGIDPHHQQEKNKHISLNEKLIETIKVYQNLLIHRAEHLCKTTKKTSEKVLTKGNSNKEELGLMITNKSNATKNFLSNVAKDVNDNKYTTIIGSIQKSFNTSSEIELMTEDEKKP